MDKTPQQLAEERLMIAEEYALLGQRKVELMYKRAEYYNENRQEHKSDASVMRAWEVTEDGLDLMVIKEKMKSKEHRLSAIRTLLEVANKEAFNQY